MTCSSAQEYNTVASEKSLLLAPSGPGLLRWSSGLYFGVGSQLEISLINLTKFCMF